MIFRKLFDYIGISNLLSFKIELLINKKSIVFLIRYLYTNGT